MAPDDLCAHIPHAGSMCLLDEILFWDDHSIRCHALRPNDPDNPLRRNGHLAAVHLIEYAGQASALHGSLLARSRGVELVPSALAAVRDLELHIDTIDRIAPPLVIEAKRVLEAGTSAIYAFRAESDGRILSRGRLTVMPLAGA